MPKHWSDKSMNDPRDFLALARFGNLGILLLGIGLLGVLIHRQPMRQAIAVGICLLGLLFVSEGTALLHGAPLPVRNSISVVVIGLSIAVLAIRSALVEWNENRRHRSPSRR